jgi:hypothetical protein
MNTPIITSSLMRKTLYNNNKRMHKLSYQDNQVEFNPNSLIKLFLWVRDSKVNSNSKEVILTRFHQWTLRESQSKEEGTLK